MAQKFICLIFAQLLAEQVVLTFKSFDGVALACDSLLLLLNPILQFFDILTCNAIIHFLELFLQKKTIIHRGMSAGFMWWVGIKDPARLLESFVCLHVSQLLSRDTITFATEVVDIQLPEPIAKRTDGIVADSLDVPVLDS